MIEHKIDEYLNEGPLSAMDQNIKGNETSNITTGIRRIQFRLERANTPQKYVDAFETVNRLIEKFPLKSKIIWQAVSDAYVARYGSVTSPATKMSDAPEQESVSGYKPTMIMHTR